MDNKLALKSGGARDMWAAEARMFAGGVTKVVIGGVVDQGDHQQEPFRVILCYCANQSSLIIDQFPAPQPAAQI